MKPFTSKLTGIDFVAVRVDQATSNRNQNLKIETDCRLEFVKLQTLKRLILKS